MFEIYGPRARQIISICLHSAKNVAVFVIRKLKFVVHSSSPYLIWWAIDPTEPLARGNQDPRIAGDSGNVVTKDVNKALLRNIISDVNVVAPSVKDDWEIVRRFFNYYPAA